MKVILTVTKGPEPGRQFVFDKPDTFLVGRSKDCHFRLPSDDPYVGRRHLIIEICPPRCVLRDLNSTNTPHVNGQKATECELKSGDQVEVGYTLLSVDIELEVEHVPCKKCGAAIPVAGNDSPEICDKCAAAREKRAPAKEVRVSKPTTKCGCGFDLTKEANNDGRALELGDEVEYVCPACALPQNVKREQTGDYVVIKEIGKGGMGKVYLAYHPKSARLLVMKKIKNLSDEHLIKRFEREVRFTRDLVHPNLVRYVDSGIDDTEPYLVMQYVRGGCLSDLLLTRNRPLETREAIGYISGALEGLEAMHRNGIVHRDIKAENILIKTNEAGKPTPKLADFGLAKKFTESGGMVLTQPGIAMGTILYMPPEQIKDTASVREPADTYSMGVTLYYLLTGQFPYDFPTKLELKDLQQKDMKDVKLTDILMHIVHAQKLNPMQIILEREPIPISARNSSVPRKLAGIVDKAVRKDQGSRYQSAAEFRKELLKAL